MLKSKISILNSYVDSSRTPLSRDNAETFNRFFANVGLEVQKKMICTPGNPNQKNFSMFIQQASIMELDSFILRLVKIFVKLSKHETAPL